MVDGVEGELKAVGDAELVEDLVQVVLDRLLTNEQLLGDLFVLEALRDAGDDFAFAVADGRFLTFSGSRSRLAMRTAAWRRPWFVSRARFLPRRLCGCS